MNNADVPVTFAFSERQIKTEYKLTDAPVVQTDRADILPDEVQFRWHHYVPDGNRIGWEFRITVFGPKIRSNGSIGTQRWNRSWYGTEKEVLAEMPTWLRPVYAAARADCATALEYNKEQ